jgi:hypothetical protein
LIDVQDRVLSTSADLAIFGDGPDRHRNVAHRVSADIENVERGLAQLVLTLVELLRQLMERQAIRRMDNGSGASSCCWPNGWTN